MRRERGAWPWPCPNRPSCGHGGHLHDVEDWEDVFPTCTVNGCGCGHVQGPQLPGVLPSWASLAERMGWRCVVLVGFKAARMRWLETGEAARYREQGWSVIEVGDRDDLQRLMGVQAHEIEIITVQRVLLADERAELLDRVRAIRGKNRAVA